jgi:hypothetical protein
MKQKNLFAFLCLATVIASACGDKEQALAKNDHDLTLSYTPLRPGEISPRGWLKDWAIQAAEGITGHLDERTNTYAKGWSGESYKARGANEEGTGWPLEQSAYWLDGLVKLAYILNDSTLIAKAQSRLDPVVDGVLKGGETFMHWRPLEQLDGRFDNWAHSHMGRALVAYYSATQEQQILDALVRVYKNYYYPAEVPPSFGRVNGVVNMDPILETYAISNDPGVLTATLDLLQRDDFKRLVRMWNQDSLREGHTVIFYENSRIPALVYALNGEPTYLDATIKALNWADERHLLPIGLISGEEWMSGIGSTRNVETCNVAAGGWTYHWLLRITGEGQYADRMEKIFFNAGPVPISRDFQTMCYYQSPNKIGFDLPKEEPLNPGPGSYRYTELGHEVLCCVGNSNRIIPNYISNMWMRSGKDGLAAVLYGPSQLTTTLNGHPVSIKSETAYPFEERIRMSIELERKTRFTLHLRIPGWCKDPEIAINGESVPIRKNDRGFLILERNWAPGDDIELNFPMYVAVHQGRETGFPHVSYFKDKEGSREISMNMAEISSPYGAVLYGPLVFALPLPDSGANHPILNVPFGYALNLDPDNPDTHVDILRKELKRPWKWQLKESPLSITVPALQFDWNPTMLEPLPPQPVQEGEPVHITLLPYNVTKFRVTMFPVSADTWKYQ